MRMYKFSFMIIGFIGIGLNYAEARVEVIPYANGCKGAIIYNTSNRTRGIEFSYIYEGEGGSYYSGTAGSLGTPIAPGGSFTIPWLYHGPVDCNKPYTVRIPSEKTYDFDTAAENERRNQQIQSDREKQATMGLARLIDKENERKGAIRAYENEEKRKRREAEWAKNPANPANFSANWEKSRQNVTLDCVRNCGRQPIVPRPAEPFDEQAAADRARMETFRLKQLEQEDLDRQKRQEYQNQLIKDQQAQAQWEQKQRAEAAQQRQMQEMQRQQRLQAEENERRRQELQRAAEIARQEKIRLVKERDRDMASSFDEIKQSSLRKTEIANQEANNVVTYQRSENSSLAEIVAKRKAEKAARIQNQLTNVP